VEIRSADGENLRSGEETAHIRPSPAHSLNVTTIFDDNGAEPPNLNTIYQEIGLGQPTPPPWDFLVWGIEGNTPGGLVLKQTDPTGGTLMRDGVASRWPVSRPGGSRG